VKQGSTAMRPTRGVRLRCALIWHDEVMGDVVLDRPDRITLGDSHKSTFTIPDIGLPDNFSIVRPGNRGYLLTLSEQMRGRISVDGKETDVADFVRRGDADGHGFRATPIGGRDWGVIDLDASGETKLYFHFVPVDPPLPTYMLSALELFMPALAFSVVLHVAFIIVSYQLESGENAFVWPGKRSLTGAYLATRIEPPPIVEPPKPVVGKKAAAEAASEKGEKEKVKSATKNNEGKSGGQGEKRAKDPNAPDDVPNPPKVAFFADKNKKYIDQMLQTNNLTSLNKFMAVKGQKTPGMLGMGKGTGTGVGDDLDGSGTTKGSKGKGTGGGGSAEGDFVSQGKIDTGETRSPKGTGGTGSGPKEIKVGFEGGASGDFSGLTKEEIDRVVKSRSGLIKACYQKELNRTRGLGGKLVVNFVISADGTVKSTRIEGGKSSLRNNEVESCVRSNIQRLKFPAKGGGVVNYPFIFSQGG
jgi:hypothetical protein